MYTHLFIKVFLPRVTGYLKLMSSCININEKYVDFVDINECMTRTHTLIQSHTLTWFLDPTGINLQASDYS